VVGYLSFHELFLEIAIPTYINCFRGNVSLMKLQWCNIPRDYEGVYKKQKTNYFFFSTQKKVLIIGRNVSLLSHIVSNDCRGKTVLHPIKLSGGDDVVEIAHNFMYTV